MKLTSASLASCAVLLFLSSSGAVVQQAAAQPAAAATVAPTLDPDAVSALERMGAALRSHSAFVMNADVTREDVLGSGEKLQFAGTVEMRVQRPDGFKVSMVSDTQEREIYYDGKFVTIFSPRLNMYASFAAPPTIAQTLDVARKHHGLELPLADLFTWGSDRTHQARLTSGFLVRPEHIEGRTCDHYAFRQEKVDWQIWIAQDQSALPCKLVVTRTDDASRPQFTAVMHWSFPGAIERDTFAFTPPPGSNRIMIARIDTLLAGGKRP